MRIFLEALKELRDLDEDLTEDVASSLPAQCLPRDEVYDAIDSVKAGTYVNAGYLHEVTDKLVASAWRGGRGSEGNAKVRLFKVTEVYGRCGIDYESIQAIKDKRAAGIERQGNKYEMTPELGNKIFKSSTGKELLQIFPRSKSDIKSRYYISFDDEDLHEISKDEVKQYCVAAAFKPSGEFDPSKPMRWDLNNIYWFKNLGHSILR